jgi:hypothetical protein
LFLGQTAGYKNGDMKSDPADEIKPSEAGEKYKE